jgi:murein DD-endopeptidase MepM/ murein hydrolase activator NlpD
MQRFLACLLLLLTLTACGQNSGATPDLETAVPYHTVTPSQTPTLIPALTEIILPAPTTFTYTVAQGDTLSGIAQRNGVTVEALLAANPGIQPTALSVGTKLVIPTGSEVPGEPTPTPALLPVVQARCWPEADGGQWCFALVQNDYAETLENLSAQFTLLDSGGQELTSQIVFGLLDILPPGASMPLAAHFAPPAPADAGLRAQVLTAIRLLPGDTRYLPVMLENTLVSVEASGRTAQVTGRVMLTGAGTANTLWVLATAYDAAGNVIGVRRWDSPSALMADVPVSFDFLVFSVGPEIARVEFLAEARP